MKEQVVITYAQNREDVLLDAFFTDGHQGFYVDVGASDPEKFSVTKLFYDKGWSGLNIEPNKSLVEKLQNARPRDTTINAAIGNKPGTATFRQYAADGLSTLSVRTKKRLSNKEVAAEYIDVDVTVMTLANVFSEYANGKVIDFMNVDVEGFEYEVLTSNDWKKYRPRVLCIEADKIDRDWPKFLTEKFYEKIFNDGLNDYYVDTKHPLKFDYLHRVIGRAIYPAAVVELKGRISELNNEKLILESELQRLRRLVSTKDEEIEFLHMHVAELNRFKNMVKNLAVKVHTIIDLRLSEQFKRKKLYPKILLNVKEANQDELLTAIQRADHDVFYRRPSMVEYAKMNSAKVLYRTYKIATKVTKKSAKATRRAVKKVRG